MIEGQQNASRYIVYSILESSEIFLLIHWTMRLLEFSLSQDTGSRLVASLEKTPI